jgi:hypothetical protein
MHAILFSRRNFSQLKGVHVCALARLAWLASFLANGSLAWVKMRTWMWSLELLRSSPASCSGNGQNWDLTAKVDAELDRSKASQRTWLVADLLKGMKPSLCDAIACSYWPTQ